ncbi:MAG: transcriptional repressor [Bacilli bacterium]|nr:transcriptional repressor [Bacilli bacterium]
MESYNTKQKDLILNVLKNKKKEFTVKDIYNELDNKVGLTTIYRLVDKLVLENRINKSIKNNIVYYQYLEDCNEENHFYLKCDKCGSLVHIDCDCIIELSNHIFKEHNFRPNREKIIISGICSNCLGRD